MRLRWVATLIRIRSWRLIAACSAIGLLTLGNGRVPLAQVGKRQFVDPLITQNPNPSNELELQPSWNKSRTGNEYTFEFSLEKKLSQNFSIEIEDELNQISPRQGPDVRGMGSLQFFLKYAFYTSIEHEMRFGIGATAFLPVGTLDAGAQSHTSAGPLLTYEKGMGDLPDRGFTLYLRPFAIEGDFAYVPSWSGPQRGQFFSDLCLSYQFYYLRDSGIELPLADFVDDLEPFVEFNWQQVAVGRDFNTPPDFRITPAVAYGMNLCQLTVGTQLGLNHEASLNNQAAVIFLLDIYLAKIWPSVFRWTAF